MYSLAFFCTFLFVIIFCILAKKWADFEVKNGVRWRRSIRSAAGWRLLLTLLLFFLIVSLFCACLFGFQIWVRLYRCKRLSRVKIFRLEDKRGREIVHLLLIEGFDQRVHHLPNRKALCLHFSVNSTQSTFKPP